MVSQDIRLDCYYLFWQIVSIQGMVRNQMKLCSKANVEIYPKEEVS